MNDNIFVAIASLIGTIIGAFGGMQVVKYRIEQMEKKLDKIIGSNEDVNERVYVLEGNQKSNELEHRVFNHRITNLERSVLNERPL